MASLRTLDRRLDRISERLNRGIERLMAEVIGAIGEELVPATPVDTGFARANWRPSLNAPTESTISFLDPTGAATVSRIKTAGRRWRVGNVFYIVNHTPYIPNLIAGSSPQAPANFHVQAVDRGTQKAFARIRSTGLGLER